MNPGNRVKLKRWIRFLQCIEIILNYHSKIISLEKVEISVKSRMLLFYDSNLFKSPAVGMGPYKGFKFLHINE